MKHLQMIKKSPTSCRAFSYWLARYNSCRTSHPSVELIIFVLCFGTSCSLCLHHIKNLGTDLDAIRLNSCKPKRTWKNKLNQTYPQNYPQKLWIVFSMPEVEPDSLKLIFEYFKSNLITHCFNLLEIQPLFSQFCLFNYLYISIRKN